MEEKNVKRSKFSSNLGMMLACIGGAVGLGNVWGFPSKLGRGGGFYFLIIYVVVALLLGIPMTLSEYAIGRKMRKGPIAAWTELNRKWKFVGILNAIVCVGVMGFYCLLFGWIIKYMVEFGIAIFNPASTFWTMDSAEYFSMFISNPVEPLVWTFVGLLLSYLCVRKNMAGGIEKACKWMIPALVVLLIVVAIRACTLPGAADGLKYMFVPGWAVANGVIPEAPSIFNVISTAGGQMFFSLSIGMGAMITYGSYLDKKEHLEKNAVLIIVMDTLVALMAGLCVMPARFALDPEGPIGGPKLLFITMQNVFDSMDGAIGPIFGIIFYLLVVLAAVSSSISLLETVVAHFVDEAREKGKGDRRKKYSLIASILIALLCVLVCVDGLGSNGIAPWELLKLDGYKGWSDCWLDFFDMISEGVFMPFGGLLMTLMIGWEIGPEMVKDECEATEGHKMSSYPFFKVCCKYITPLCMLLILYGQLKSFFG